MGIYNLTPVGEPQRDMYHVRGLTDLSKIQDEAFRRSSDGGKPVLVNIHHHRHGVPCSNYKHESYKNREQVPFNG